MLLQVRLRECRTIVLLFLIMLLLSFMAETRDHDRYAKDFVDVALIHDVGVEPQLEDDLLLLLLLCDVALSTGLKIRSCCIS